MSEFKTNVMRILDKAKITYKAHTYDHSDGAIDGAAVAEKDGAKIQNRFSKHWLQRVRAEIIMFL